MKIRPPFTEKLSFGHIIVCSLQPVQDASSVYISLFTSRDIALGILFNFEKNQIERYIKKNGKKEHIETKENVEPSAPAVPQRAKIFRACVFCEENQYSIWVNDQPYCRYAYHIPLKDVEQVEVGSNGLQKATQLDIRKIFPSPWPLIQYDENILDFSNELPIPLTPNNVMTVTGHAEGNQKGGFILFLRDGATGQEALNFNVDFNKKKIIRKAMKDPCGYGTEQTDGPFPFKFEEKFRIAIGFYNDRFSIGVNGVRIPDFKHAQKNILNTLVGFKIRSYGDLNVIIHGITYNQFQIEDCIDYKFESIFNEEEKVKPRPRDMVDCDEENPYESSEEEDCTEDDETVQGYRSFPSFTRN